MQTPHLYDPEKDRPDAYQKAASASGESATAAGTPKPDIWRTAFAQSIMDGTAFMAQHVEPRAALLGSFFRDVDYGLIFAPRGVGKTWMAMLMADAIAEGRPLGEWAAGDAGPRNVLFVDGEVNLPDTIERAQLVGMSPRVHWLHHETVTANTGRSLNLANPEQQRCLLGLMIERDIRVLFLDNLSCLMRGVAENEADEWEKVADWLLELRRGGVTVVLILHAGRNGQPRGTSRREDNAHWILSLEEAGDSDSESAILRSRFTKNRNARRGAASGPPLEWTLTTVGGRLDVKCQRHSDVNSLVELVKGGITSAGDIARELGITPGTASKWARKAAESGRIKIEGRAYKPFP